MTMPGTTLAQILALEDGARTDAKKVETAAYHLLQKTDPLSGLARTYQPFADDGVMYPAESKRLQVKSPDEIARVTAALTRAWDLAATKDEANTEARGDVVVDGVTVLSNVPVTTLLWLDKALGDLKTLVASLPTLDPTVEWEYDDGNGYWRSAPAKTVKSKKVLKTLVKYEATPEHPAQTEAYTEDVPEGEWTVVRFSGALPAVVVARYVARVSALRDAVRAGRAAANTGTVTDASVGSALFGFIFG